MIQIYMKLYIIYLHEIFKKLKIFLIEIILYINK